MSNKLKLTLTLEFDDLYTLEVVSNAYALITNDQSSKLDYSHESMLSSLDGLLGSFLCNLPDQEKSQFWWYEMDEDCKNVIRHWPERIQNAISNAEQIKP